MLTSDSRVLVTVAQLGELKAGDARNACNLANQLQNAFQFDWLGKALKFEKATYALPNGGFDLSQAAADILTEKSLPHPLILLTSLPLSSPEDGEDKDGLLFCNPIAPTDSDSAVVSTHLWEKALNQRLLQPYLMFMLGGLGLQFCSNLAYHEETSGCYFDTCQKNEDVKEAFKTIGGVCDSCEHQLESKIRKGVLRVEQVAAAKRLFNRAGGKKVCFMAMPFQEKLQPVYDLITDALIQRGWTIIRADEISRPRRIIDRILLSILASDLVLADLTDNNPNVFYELGLAHAVGSDVILLTQEAQLPFDVSTEQTIFYKTTEPELKKLSRHLARLAGKGTW
jgi:hypothetical protein